VLTQEIGLEGKPSWRPENCAADFALPKLPKEYGIKSDHETGVPSEKNNPTSIKNNTILPFLGRNL